MAVIFGASCFLFKKILSSLAFILLFFQVRTAGHCEDHIHISLCTFPGLAPFPATVSILLLSLYLHSGFLLIEISFRSPVPKNKRPVTKQNKKFSVDITFSRSWAVFGPTGRDAIISMCLWLNPSSAGKPLAWGSGRDQEGHVLCASKFYICNEWVTLCGFFPSKNDPHLTFYVF